MQPSNAQVVEYLSFVNSAYLMFGQDGSNLRPPPIGIPKDYGIVAYLNSIDPDSGRRVFFGFLAASANLQAPAIVAIRGTYDISEWFTDADLLPVAFPPYSSGSDTVYVETGFYEFYQHLEWLPAKGEGGRAMTTLEAVGTNHQGIVIAGHSLGGAIGTLIVADLSIKAPKLKIELITAACPATGDGAFAAKFDALVPRSYRYINDLDTIASSLDLLYTQTSTAISLCSIDIYPTPECEHSLLTYIYLLSPDGTPCTTDCCILTEDLATRERVQRLIEMRRRKSRAS